ncbi:MAG TPA: hypothetical protein VEL47_07480 [Myxococcota bacterium]|nr:hypothetical protein [Myxococcota bacterium]
MFIVVVLKSLPLLIAICAIGALLHKRPSISAIFLLMESVLLTINLAIIEEPKSNLLVTSVVISFFAMVLLGNNLYLELAHKTPPTKFPKLNIVIGGFFLLVFWSHLDKISLSTLIESSKSPPTFTENSLMVAIFGFALFVILVAALTILDLKTSNRDARNDF